MAKLLKSVFGKKNQPSSREFLGGRPYDYCSNSLGDLTSPDNPLQPAGSLSSFHQAGLSTSASTNNHHKNDIQTSERYRHHSNEVEDEGAGITDDFVYRGAGALNLMTNGNRRTSDAGDRDGYRRNEMGEMKSPTSKKPIMSEDYSDPKDVLKAVKESGIVIPPEKPEMAAMAVHQYPEDDYSVPYEAQRIIRQMRSEDQKKGESKHGRKGSRHSDDAESWSVPNKPTERYKHHTYEEPPDVSPPPFHNRPETPDSYVGESSDELNGHSPASLSPSPSPLRIQTGYSHREQHSSSPMSSESGADDTFPPKQHHSSGAANNHRQQTPQHDQRAAGEYDNPWEWSENNPLKIARLGPGAPGNRETGMSPDSLDSPRGRSRSELPPMPSRVMRTSPESDTRPGDEYDQPWEWMPMNRKPSQAITDKEKHIAGRVLPLLDNKKAMKLDIKPKPAMHLHAELIDPKLPLEHQTWYHGKLSRSDAEKKLWRCKEGSYLVRKSESAARDYSLSLKSAKGFMHMKIVYQQGGFVLGEFSKPFPNIPEMIFYYTQHKLNIRGAEHMALLHPVADQLL